jgi:hypothetical protein
MLCSCLRPQLREFVAPFVLFIFNSSARLLFQGAANVLPGQMPRYGDGDLLFVLAGTTNIGMHTHVWIDRQMPRYMRIHMYGKIDRCHVMYACLERLD